MRRSPAIRSAPARLPLLRWFCALCWLCVQCLAACASSRRAELPCAQAVQGLDFAFSQLGKSDIERRLQMVGAENALRASTVQHLFREAGCASNLALQPVPGSESPNIVCSLPGRSDRRILVSAHFDKVAAGQGAVDNWTGAALLSSLYQSLRASERAHSYEFIAFTDEELGLVGSRAYVGQLPVADRARIAAVVNLDSLGLGPASVDEGTSNAELACYLKASATLLGDAPHDVELDELGTSDFEPFRELGLPVVSIHSVSRETFSLLHSERDTLAAIDRSAYYESYRLIALYLVVLDRALAADS